MSQERIITSAPLSCTWRLVLWANVIIGIILWFGLCTDYSWDSLWANICYPPIVGVVGLMSLIAVLTKRQYLSKAVFCLPSIIGGMPYIIIPVFATIICWPGVFGIIYYGLGEEATATRIEQTVSPDGSKIAEVYFQSLDISGKSGKIDVHLKYKWLPFVKRDIHGFGYVDKNTKGYLTWQDNNTLYIFEKKVHADRELQIEVGLVKWRIPFIPLYLQR